MEFVRVISFAEFKKKLRASHVLASLIRRAIGKFDFKPAAHLRKELSKVPREAVCSAVSSRVRQSFGEKFASRGREDKIRHVGYFWPREANSSMCAAIVRIWLSLVNQPSNENALHIHVTSEFMMASGSVVSEFMLEEKLVELWPEYSCLYDVSSTEFKNRDRREVAMSEIAEKLG